MDPLHPIVPIAPRMAPIAPAPGVRPASPDAGQPDARERRRRRAAPAPDLLEEDSTPESEDLDDGHPHIDVIA